MIKRRLPKILLIALIIIAAIFGFWFLSKPFRVKRAEAYLGSADPVAYLKASVLTPFSPLVYLKIGGAYEERGQIEKAEKEFKKAIWLCEKFTRKNNALLASPEYKEALLSLRKIQAKKAAEEGDLEKLESSLASALELEQANDEVNFWLSFLYAALGNYELAKENLKGEISDENIRAQKEVLQEALDKISSTSYGLQATSHPKTLIGLAYLKMDYPKMAVLQFEKALEIEPDYRDARIYLGKIYLELNEPEKALIHLEKAAEIDPVHAKTFYQLSLAYQKNKQTDQAQKALNKAKMLGWEN